MNPVPIRDALIVVADRERPAHHQGHRTACRRPPWRTTMTDAKDQGLERRTFLKQMAVASTAPLAPGLLGAATAQEGSVHQETAHETERLAAYAAGLRYEDLPAP